MQLYLGQTTNILVTDLCHFTVYYIQGQTDCDVSCVITNITPINVLRAQIHTRLCTLCPANV